MKQSFILRCLILKFEVLIVMAFNDISRHFVIFNDTFTTLVVALSVRSNFGYFMILVSTLLYLISVNFEAQLSPYGT